MTSAAFNRGKSKQDYETPADFMAAVEARFGGIAFDLAADGLNKKAPLYFNEANDALAQDWSPDALNVRDWTRRWLWLNPPFANIKPWAQKCNAEFRTGADILFLVPAAVGSNWWRDYVDGQAAVLFLNGRIHFDPTNPKWGYPKDCALCVFSKRIVPGYAVWNWKEKSSDDLAIR
jgi:phage N-6-adenine-methyltransferase